MSKIMNVPLPFSFTTLILNVTTIETDAIGTNYKKWTLHFHPDTNKKKIRALHVLKLLLLHPHFEILKPY